MAAPALAIYSFLYLYPALTNLLYATQRWDGVTTPEFVGLKNFQNLLTNDDLFLKILGNNVRFSLIVVIFQTGFALLFATFLLKNTKTNIFLRTVYFFPTILSSVSVGLIWTFLYDQMVVIYVAGLQQIPAELYEAADVDGASRWQQFKNVTWPMALPTTAVVVAYTTIQTFRAFDLIYAMTQGGPLNSSDLLVTMVFNTAFVGYKFGYAATQTIFLVLLVLLVTYLQRRVLRINDGIKK